MLQNATVAHGLTSKTIESRLRAEDLSLVRFFNPWKFYSSQANGVVCSFSSKRITLLGRIRIEQDMFDDEPSRTGIGEVATEEGDKNDEDEQEVEEDVRLVPQQWRVLQDDLSRTRNEKKQQARIRAREDELERANMLLLKKKQLEAAGKALKERTLHGSQKEMTTSTSEPAFYHKTLSTPVISNLEKGDRLNQSHQGSLKRTLELECIFSEDEITLLKGGAPNTDKLDCKKWLPLHVLVSAGQFFSLDEYLKSDMDLDAIDEDGFTAIHRAILGRKETAVSQLLRAGANPYILDKDGASYLHYIAQTGSVNLMKLFVKCGVDINLSDQDGWTALHVAVLTCREDLLRLLLLSGADKKQTTKDGYTPLDLCFALGSGSKTFAIAKNLKRFCETQPSFEGDSDIQKEMASDIQKET